MRIATLALVIPALLASPALACDEHTTPGKEPVKEMSRPSGWVDGEVREVDLDDGTLSVSHGKIAAWNMKPMESMVFKADTSLIGRLKAGDKVRFRAGMLGQQPAIREIKLANK